MRRFDAVAAALLRALSTPHKRQAEMRKPRTKRAEKEKKGGVSGEGD